MSEPGSEEVVTHSGSCHCGQVQFEFEAPAEGSLSDCNCSICRMTGHQHLVVDKPAFRLLHGEDALTCYEFNTGVAKHYFCKHCGIKSFYVPRSRPDGISVNARCLKPGTFTPLSLIPFDGVHWEKNVHLLRSE